MTDIINEILSRIGQLGADELLRVRKAIDAMLSLKGVKVSTATTQEPADKGKRSEGTPVMYLAHIRTEMQLRGHPPPGLYTLTKSRWYKNFSERVYDVDEWLKTAAPKMSSIQHEALVRICFRCLGDKFERMKLGHSIQNYMTRLDLIHEALDQAFPGYLESGMIGYIVQQEEQNVRKKYGR